MALPSAALPSGYSEADIRLLARHFGPSIRAKARVEEDPVAWGQKNFYVPETGSPIRLSPHQAVLLRSAFDPVWAAKVGCPAGFQTYIYSTVKKSGKTTIASMVARWIAETWGDFNEVYCMANDMEQARGRVYAKALQSFELHPDYDKGKRILPGRWRVIERDATHIPTGSILRAVSMDYKGEAGANQTGTFWSELWGYTTEASKKMWAELTPVPTRPRSIRWVETYAGYENESTLLMEQWDLAQKDGRRVTRDEMPDWPWDEDPPVWINPTARLWAYIDQGPQARRMPWQTPEYYAAQAKILTPDQFDRLHGNFWTSAISNFIPIEWWDRQRAGFGDNPALLPLDRDTPVVLGADASVTSDCTSLVAVSRHPNPEKHDHMALRWAKTWYPSQGHPMDYDATLKPAIIEACRDYNVVEVVYDPYQLHHMMNELRQEGHAWCSPFAQGEARMKADKQLYDTIRDRRWIHGGDDDVREHMKNAGAKQDKNEDTKLRIIKKAEDKKIDSVVALSMAAFECLRLNL